MTFRFKPLILIYLVRRAEIFWSDSMCLKIEMNMLAPPKPLPLSAPSSEASEKLAM